MWKALFVDFHKQLNGKKPMGLITLSRSLGCTQRHPKRGLTQPQPPTGPFAGPGPDEPLAAAAAPSAQRPQVAAAGSGPEPALGP